MGLKMGLKVGSWVKVIDLNGKVIEWGQIQDSLLTGRGNRWFAINGSWFLREQVSCGKCEEGYVCPQCGQMSDKMALLWV